MNKDKKNSSESDFTEVFESFYNTLLKIVYHICGRKEVAEEICQEAFLRYFERCNHVGGGDVARYWLIRVAKNLTFNYEKRQKREYEANRSHSQEVRIELHNEGENSVLKEDVIATVRDAIASIPYKLRIALILREYNDYPYSAIAKILHISESNVKIRIFRARKHLFKLLTKEDVYVP